MKAICDARKWCYDPKKVTGKALLDLIFTNELVDPALASHFSGLRTTLEAGVPTIRNRMGGHGQGAEPVVVPDYLASYAIHLKATNIVLLVEAHNARK